MEYHDHTDSPCGSTNSDDSTLPSQTSLNNSLSASHSTSLNETSRPSNSFRYPFPDQDVRISGHPRYNALPEPLLPSPSPFNSPLLPPSNHFHSPSPPPPDAEPKRIPRPPNAFILYRSDVLRQIRTGQRQLPYNEQEKKQQVLSRVAGEGWNLLSPEEKKVWQDKAAEVQAEHHKKYPTYKFTPSARGPALRKRKGGQAGQFSSDDGSEVDEKVRIREMREMYLHIAGPAIPSAPRRRRTRAQTAPKADYSSEVSFRAQDPHFVPLPPSFPPTPLSTPELSARNGATLPPFFPRPTYPLYPDQIANFAYGGVHHNDFGGEHMMFPFSTAAMGGSYPSSAASSPGASTSMHMHNDHNTMFVHQANASTSYFPPPQHGQRAFFPAPHPHGVHQYDNHMRAHSSSPLSLSPVSVINAGMVNFPNHGYLYTMPASAPASPASLASPPPPSAYSGSRPSSAASSDQMHGQETMASPPKTPSLTASSDDGLSERTRNLDITPTNARFRNASPCQPQQSQIHKSSTEAQHDDNNDGADSPFHVDLSEFLRDTPGFEALGSFHHTPPSHSHEIPPHPYSPAHLPSQALSDHSSRSSPHPLSHSSSPGAGASCAAGDAMNTVDPMDLDGMGINPAFFDFPDYVNAFNGAGGEFDF